jgi:protein-L-isoaspartate(D-aspartate) O-methyltransferase
MRQRWSSSSSEAGAPADARRKMVERDLIGRGITSPDVLDAMRRVPRERFVDAVSIASAYDDRALGIECEQTISQPYIVALMTESLEISSQQHVLEIGTGSGYQTAVLAELAHDVVTVERHEQLSQRSRAILQELGYKNIEFVVGDGTLGWPAGAPYDRIMITAGAEQLPAVLWSQLAEGGRLVMPIGPPHEQFLQVVTKHNGQRHERTLTGCRFVPLIAGTPPPAKTANLEGE